MHGMVMRTIKNREIEMETDFISVKVNKDFSYKKDKPGDLSCRYQL